MPYTELQPEQLEKTGALLKPIVPGYNSVFFHPLTKHGDCVERQEWELELTDICKNDDALNTTGLLMNTLIQKKEKSSTCTQIQ